MKSDRGVRWLALGALFVALWCGSAQAAGKEATATFGGGCFWCLEQAMDKLPGVLSTASGFMGGHVADPSYKQVSAGGTGHVEVVQVRYDPTQLTYYALLNHYWRNIDPLQANGQFCDHGPTYRSVIFTHTPEQEREAKKSRMALEDDKPFPGEIVTQILPAGPFYPAEEYHQDYYQKNPIRYNYYKFRCGRAQRLETLWGKENLAH
ncbi:peptide-methionine (S)-S-oxide reductase MsrA [Magnetofaba australis]|uniref:Peptide methionine sulfoxide reductase MsrA n=1 Tax=Magnetofaba australis IT-1 TaxID=1434232 RepID=A0A1Y2K2U8_9PROT|nr:peptide-methionine (S)-S-oxide reductase MsrA [Magnetofaba australis]OSM02269.1 putative peptide methionine sulfoxide reductase MsrA [Magnetofaba australis IT-1]